MAWALDLDGVIWRGDDPIDGSAAAVERLRAAGEDVVFVTNNASQPVETVEAKLGSMGIPAAGDVVTSAQAGASLVAPEETVLVVGGPGVADAVRQQGNAVVEDGAADVVVVGFDPDFDITRLRAATRAIHGGARLIATNDDPTYPTADGIDPGGGALVAAVATAGGLEPLVAGKPHQPMADLIRDRVGPAGVMVGDRPSTDGAFAKTLGYEFALVLSGVVAAADLPVDPAPDHVGADLATVVSDLL